MKLLQAHSFNAVNCRSEWNGYQSLLQSKAILSEQKDILPFFKKSKDLSLLIGNYIPKIKTLDLQIVQLRNDKSKLINQIVYLNFHL